MLVTDENGREIEITLYGRHSDDIQIDEAYYTDTEEEVSEATIEYIYERFGDDMYEEWMMDKACAAEALQDLFEDQ